MRSMSLPTQPKSPRDERRRQRVKTNICYGFLGASLGLLALGLMQIILLWAAP